MKEYTIAAIPTQYRGIMYRSRLEARWAAFFDRLGWTYEYEPFDLGKWSPDFAITAPFDALIEVKPITEFDSAIAEKMNDAHRGFNILVGVAPVRPLRSIVEIGWLAISYQPAMVMWRTSESSPKFYADVLTFLYDPEKQEACHSLWASDRELMPPDQYPPNTRSYGDYTMGLWAEACNAVQWEPSP